MGRTIEVFICINNRLILVLAAHVDDIEGVAKCEIVESPLVHLSKAVGDCTAECGTFMHLGMQHEHAAGNACTHRNSNIKD